MTMHKNAIKPSFAAKVTGARPRWIQPESRASRFADPAQIDAAARISVSRRGFSSLQAMLSHVRWGPRNWSRRTRQNREVHPDYLAAGIEYRASGTA